jgi:hypothetical protein
VGRRRTKPGVPQEREFVMGRLGLGLLAASASLAATAVAAGDRSDIKMVIERQVAGLRSADPLLLADTISAETRAMFADEQSVLAALKQRFPGAAGMRIADFGPGKHTEQGFVQAVRITDDRGRIWQAVYVFTRNGTGRWLVDNIVILEVPTVSA